MILRGNIRGNGKQLGYYLMTKGDNERIRILEVDGDSAADPRTLHQTIQSMGLMAELTKSDKGYYHAQINPAYKEDKQMDDAAWGKAADILANELGYQDQRRVVVLHEKKGRVHAHVVFERYNYETGKLIDNKQSRLKQDKARKEMERVFEHKQTPHRNVNKAALRETATKLWNETQTGAQFIKAARKAGYMVAEGTANRPFMIVDGTGRSFDLVRQLQGVRTKEVREKLRGEKLVPEKQAIEIMREEANKSGKREQQKAEAKPAPTPATERMQQAAQSFAENREALQPDKTETTKAKHQAAFAAFQEEGQTIGNKAKNKPDDPEQRKQQIAESFAQTKATGIDEAATREQRKRELIAEQKRIQERTRIHKRSR